MEILAIIELNLSHHIPSNQIQIFMLFLSSSAVKNPPASAGDVGLVPVLERSPGEGNGHPLQCSCLGNSMDRGAWRTTVHGVAKESDTTEHIKGSCEVQGDEANSWH